MNTAREKIVHIASAYRVPIFVTLALLIAATIAFPCTFWKEISATFRDPKWLAQSTVTLFAFTIFVSWIAAVGRRDHEARNRLPFEHWTIQLKGITGVDLKPQSIHWTEAQKFEDSDFEYWKFIKSCVSNTCLIKTLDRATALDHGWLIDKDKEIIIDFSKMGEADIIRWQGEEIPHTWEWVDPPVSTPPKKVAQPKSQLGAERDVRNVLGA